MVIPGCVWRAESFDAIPRLAPPSHLVQSGWGKYRKPKKKNMLPVRIFGRVADFNYRRRLLDKVAVQLLSLKRLHALSGICTVIGRYLTVTSHQTFRYFNHKVSNKGVFHRNFGARLKCNPTNSRLLISEEAKAHWLHQVSSIDGTTQIDH